LEGIESVGSISACSALPLGFGGKAFSNGFTVGTRLMPIHIDSGALSSVVIKWLPCRAATSRLYALSIRCHADFCTVETKTSDADLSYGLFIKAAFARAA
jgi:hypothetical protein